MRYPAPLRSGSVIGITSPSSGVPEFLERRLQVAIEALRLRGYEVRVGRCMSGTGYASASARQRADELQQMLLDPDVHAIVPPWGGEMASDILDLLDWPLIVDAEPTWVVGFSDISTVITPLTLIANVATIHGSNLMDTPYSPPAGIAHWIDVAELRVGDTLEQTSPGRFRRGYVDYATCPDVSEYELPERAHVRRLDGLGGPLDAEGRLIGGCIETLSPLSGTRFLNTQKIRQADDGVIVYLEAVTADAFVVARALQGMRLAGLFEGATAVLIGRTTAPDSRHMTQDEAAQVALGPLGIPILAGVDFGHTAPSMPFVNGALARISAQDDVFHISQTLD